MASLMARTDSVARAPMPLRLLLIDDDDVDRTAVRRALKQAALECEISEAASAKLGLQLAAETAFDCVLLDYRLPERSGAEVLRDLLLQSPARPVVVLTGHGDEELAVELMKAGASDYLPKGSLSPQRLAQSIRQAVRLQQIEDDAKKAARDHATRLRALAEAAVELNGMLSAEGVAARVSDRARSILGARASLARTVRRQGGGAGPGEIPVDEETFTRILVGFSGPIRAEGASLASIPAVAQLASLGFPSPHDSWLVAPLVGRRGERIGVLAVCDASTGTFSENDAAILVQLAQTASIAVENAWLFESAAAAVKARDDMIGIVSHDLRNPLNAILFASQSLRSQEIAPTRARQLGERITRATKQMSGLLDDLLDVTRIDAGRLTIEAKPEELALVVEETIEQIRAAAEDKRVSLVAVVAPTLPLVSIDRRRLLQALSNLVANGVKFTPPGGTVRLEAEAVDGGVELRVRDTGVGISSEQLPFVFDRFWQVKDTAHLGAGLGLFITKAIVDAHRGHITVESLVGAGTTFRFTVPSAAAANEGVSA